MNMKDISKSQITRTEDLEDLIVTLQSHGIDYWTLSNNDRSVGLHRIFLYPAMMVTEVQQNLIKIIKDYKPGYKTLIDPFVGGGTSIMAGLYNGIDCYGQDINPLSILLCQVKTTKYRTEKLRNYLTQIKEKANKVKNETFEYEFNKIEKWFTPNRIQQLALIRSCILSEVNELKYRKFFWVIFAEVVRLGSNSRLSTYKLHSRTQEDISNRALYHDSIKTFIDKANVAIVDYQSHKDKINSQSNPKGKFFLKDSTKKIKKLNCGYDLLVTSPPYGDNQTTVPYGQFSYLPLQWLEFADINPRIQKEQFLDTIQHIDNDSLGGERKEGKNEFLIETSETFKRQYNQISEPKRYKLTNFYNDLIKVLVQLPYVMNKDSLQLWTIGNRYIDKIEIRNDLILEELLNYFGFTQITSLDREISRKRMPSKNKTSNTMKTEKILIVTYD